MASTHCTYILKSKTRYEVGFEIRFFNLFSVEKVSIAQRRYFKVFAYTVKVASCYHLKYLMTHVVKHKTYMELTLMILVSRANLEGLLIQSLFIAEVHCRLD